ncbi:hypothetical protein ACOME3_003148 [Neoechinorhynchus agilis]
MPYRGSQRARKPQRRRTNHRIVSTHFERIFQLCRPDRPFMTKSLVKAESSNEEKLFVSGNEFRIWNSQYSALSECISDISEQVFKVEEGDCVLCLNLGCSDTTPFHLSDLVGSSGRVYLIEPDSKSAEWWLRVSKRRQNLFVINGDPDKIGDYQPFLPFFSLIYSKSDEAEFSDGTSAAAILYLKFDAQIIIVSKTKDIKPKAPVELLGTIDISNSQFVYFLLFNMTKRPIKLNVQELECDESLHEKMEKTDDDQSTQVSELEEGEICGDD